jgi:hypothetical protein
MLHIFSTVAIICRSFELSSFHRSRVADRVTDDKPKPMSSFFGKHVLNTNCSFCEITFPTRNTTAWKRSPQSFQEEMITRKRKLNRTKVQAIRISIKHKASKNFVKHFVTIQNFMEESIF